MEFRKDDKPPAQLYSHELCHYDFQPRKRVVRSCEGYCLFFVSILNLIFAFIYLKRYSKFIDATETAESDCEVAGATIVLYYAVFATIPLGVLAMSLYLLSYCCKATTLFSFLLCPECTLRCKKKIYGIP